MMKSGWRIWIAAAAFAELALAGTASAQNAVTPSPPANQSDVGPPQLRDFTLNGTVTRPAETRPAPTATRPAPTAQPPRSAPATSTTALPPPRAPSATPAPQPAPRSTTIELPAPVAAPVEQPAETVTLAPPTPEPDAPSPILWMLAALLIGVGGAYYLFRVRPRALATGETSQFELAEPTPAPAPPPPAPPPPSGGAVVSTGLRPWLELEFQPERTIVDDQQASLEFVVVLYNSGSAPARDVTVEPGLFNASRAQDQQLAAFFANPRGGGERVPIVAPLQRVVIKSAVSLPLAQVQPLLADGRPLLVPLTAFNALYRWGSNGQGQTSASYLVGKETKGDKLAPFRLDLGPRVFRGLAAREHHLRVRR